MINRGNKMREEENNDKNNRNRINYWKWSLKSREEKRFSNMIRNKYLFPLTDSQMSKFSIKSIQLTFKICYWIKKQNNSIESNLTIKIKQGNN